MSKKLTKILSISLLALIIPVAIIVTAICLSSAVTYSLSIDTLGYENVGSISYKVNGKDYEDGIRVRKGQTVTLTVESEGYNFEGWYVGTPDVLLAEDFKGASSCAEKSYTFEVNSDVDITTVNRRIQYSVTYDGGENVSVKYGEALDTTKEVEEGKYLAGWTLDGVNYKIARFPSAYAEADKVAVLTSAIKDIHYNVSYDGARAVDVAYGSTLQAGEDEDKDNGIIFDYWSLDEVKVEMAKFEGYKNGDTVVLASHQKDMYEVEKTYKYVDIKPTAIATKDGVELTAKAGSNVDLTIMIVHLENSLNENNVFSKDYANITIGSLYTNYQTAYEKGGEAEYSLKEITVFYKNGKTESQSGGYTSESTIAELIKALEDLAGDDMTSRTEVLTLNLQFAYEAV